MKLNNAATSRNSGLPHNRSDNISYFYGDHLEDSYIQRSNDGQWAFLESMVEGKIWEAIKALGVLVVDGNKDYLRKIKAMKKNG